MDESMPLTADPAVYVRRSGAAGISITILAKGLTLALAFPARHAAVMAAEILRRVKENDEGEIPPVPTEAG